ncbi:hypothetical protein [Amycolatopsis methanolica]|uniref:Uncharacterized protein n=1 Tax=Amycolatopsis methanolica 239 TaxID=1068978 RepID=A0A076N6H5_AMYME|nr:hypothetical protein [Amycolatopsis methanolica]AIJ26391.1 hypothetical protein AMETH_6299 [Amycolatopsis methanolica 239]AIJ26450.1 hypothetical protein AMETH_6358 [Amycolatopsis methanolica 239]
MDDTQTAQAPAAAQERRPQTFADLEYGRHALRPVPTLDQFGNCTLCGEHPLIHIRGGVVVDPREFHREEQPELPLADGGDAA